MLSGKKTIMAISILCVAFSAHADNFSKLDQALPSGINALAIAPVFDFDSDGCLPSAGLAEVGYKTVA